MKIDDPNDDTTEAVMSDTTTTLRYGYAPTAAFATTRAGAERRAREAAATEAAARKRRPLHRIASLLTGAVS